MKQVLVAAVLFAAAPAFAQPASSAAQAEALFKRGKALVGEGKFPEACAAFDASQKLDPTPATRLHQANCREKNGQLATAWGHFLEAEREARALGTPDSKQLQKIASTRAAQIEKRVSTLTINVPADVTKLPGFEVWRNRDAVDPASLNAPLPIDGGTYTIAVRSLKSREWSTTISIANEKDAKTVEVPIIVEDKVVTPPKPDTAKPDVPNPDAGTHPPPVPTHTVQPTLGPMRYAAAAIAGIGVGVLVVGAKRGLSALDAQDRARALCADPAVPCVDALEASQLTRDGHADATQANISFGIGGGLVALGTLLWFVGRPAAYEVNEVALTPLREGGATVSISGAW